MRRSRLEYRDALVVSEETGIPVHDVVRAVHSYFDSISCKARSLPLDNPSRIYSREAFDCKAFVFNIPYIGRLGMSYSRYLKWRANSSKSVEQESRSVYRKQVTREDIEKMASDILAGKPIEKPERKNGSEFYKRVWLVGTEGKRLARQVIKKEKNVQNQQG